MVVKYSKSAMKTINKLDKPTKDRVRAGIEGLKQSPPQGDIKDMKGIEIKAWDPDFTRLTPDEATELKQIMEEMDRGEYVSEDAINWE